MEISLFTFVKYVMHVHMHKMYQTTLFQTLFSFALNSFLMFGFSFSRKPVSIMCDSAKNNASFIQEPNIIINSFDRYTLVFFIMSTETSSPKWLLYTGLTVTSYKFLVNISQNHTNFISFLTATTLKLAIVSYQILPA